MSCSRLDSESSLSGLADTLDPHIEQCEDCRDRLRDYQQIVHWLAAGKTAASPPSDWRHRTLARVHASRGRPIRRVGAAWAAGAAAAVGLVLVLVHFQGLYAPPRTMNRMEHGTSSDSRHPGSRLVLVFSGEDGNWRSSDPSEPAMGAGKHFWAHPGQNVGVNATLCDFRYFEIRVYRSARDLVLRCPAAGPPACIPVGDSPFHGIATSASRCQRDSESAVRPLLIWQVPSFGTYQVVLLESPQAIVPPLGSMDDDVAGVMAAGGQASDVETIDVR